MLISLNHCICALTTMLLVALVASPNGHAAEGPSASEYGTVLNLSGRQRMLTQKMSKEIMLISLDVDKDANVGALQKTASLFDKTLKGLRDGDDAVGLPPTTSRRITRQLDKVQDLWLPVQEKVQAITASKTVSEDDIAFIAEANLPLLKEMNRCVKLYEKDAAKAGLKADPSLAVTINLAGKQRMLTQKMSKEYFLVALSYDKDGNKLNVQETATLFGRTLKGLLDGDQTLELPGTQDAGIRGQLEKVQGLWSEFEPLIAKAYKSDTIAAEDIAMIAKLNVPLLKEMNAAVKMFEGVAGK